jgi:gas vesicle protein
MSDSNNSGSVNGILVAAAIGAVVGAGVALLLAPRSGKDTRDWLAQKSSEIKNRTAVAYQQGKDSMRRAAKDLGQDAEAVATTLRG